MRVTACRAVSVLTLLLFAAGFITLAILTPRIIHKIALTEIPVTYGSDSASMYRRLPVNITQRIFMFNLTNRDEFLKGATPVLQELGPYTFISVWQKDMVWDGSLIRFNESRTFFFAPELSNGSLSDEIIHADLVYLTAVRLVESLKQPWKLIAEGILEFKKVLNRHTVGELLYDGYVDEIAKYAKYFIKGLPVIDGKVGFLLGQNGSFAGEFSVFNGMNGTLDKLNEITSYENSPTVPYYGDDCNSLYGTNGELYAPFMDLPEKTISIFDTQLCRPWNLYLNSTSEYDGIMEANYNSGSDLFTATGNATIDACYEKRSSHMRGTFDASTCHFDQDIVLSLPHFLKGDERLFDNVKGLAPDPAKHDFGISVSELGVVTNLKIRVQINTFLSSDPMLKKKFVYPMFWQEFVLEDEDRATLMGKLWEKAVRPKLLLRGVALGVGAAFLIALVSLLVVFLVRDSKTDDSAPLIPNQEQPLGEDEVDVEPEDSDTGPDPEK
ncbi:scavenger receptor class B member 1 [Galendromus occidentalis]|uniref:Scavenger receptor class B member 1 n=1 Tax=Galendromus occidentalis TaxID=34638 RepID=A0AAJ6VUT7_9ACAR|nr:scavenger receptor class B member 1 [Galendromus occidentalis]